MDPIRSPSDRPHPLWTLAAVVAAAVVAWPLMRGTWLHGHDDAFITFTYARSFAEGLGLTWNGGGGLGATSPLLATVLGLLERVWALGVPTWAFTLGWIAILATAGLLAEAGRRGGWMLAGAVAGIAWAGSPPAGEYPANEYVLAIAAVAAAALAAERRSGWGLAVALAAAVAFRSEAAVAAGLVVTAALWRDGWAAARRYLVPGVVGSLVLFAGWMATLHAVSGHFLPGTLAAKRAQAASPFGFWHGGTTFLRKAWQTADLAFWPTVLPLLLVLALVGVIYLAVAPCRRRLAIPAALAVWGPCHLVVLAVLDVPHYPWYGLPLHLSLLVAAAFAVEAARRAVPWHWRVAAATGALTLLAVTVVSATYVDLGRHTTGGDDPRETAYRTIARTIATRYPPETRVVALEVGYLGYYGDFVTVDLLGLTSAEASLDAVRVGDLRRAVEVADADLAIVPFSFVELAMALLGREAQLTASHALEDVQMDTVPPLLLYRRRELPPRGEVLADLVASAPVGVRWTAHRRRLALPSIALESGESVTVEVPVTAPARLRAALATVGRKPSTLEIVAGETRREHGVPPREWTIVAVELPASTGTVRRIVFHCREDEEGAEARRRARKAGVEVSARCLVGLPHLAARDAAAPPV